MKCPKPECQAPQTAIKDSRADDSGGYHQLPVSLRGLNIVRRLRRCMACGHGFATIEIQETEFNELKRPPGRLETANVRVRP